MTTLLGWVLEIEQVTRQGNHLVRGRCVGVFAAGVGNESYQLIFLLEQEDDHVEIVATHYADRVRIVRDEGRKVPTGGGT